MRVAAKVDRNQAEIVKALRQAGATVVSAAAMGKGFPDLVVGFRGYTLLLEVKDGDKVPSAQKLTSDQVVWHRMWTGHAEIVTSIDEAIDVLERISAKVVGIRILPESERK